MKNSFQIGTLILLILIIAGCNIQVPVQPGAAVSENTQATATPLNAAAATPEIAATAETPETEAATSEATIDAEEPALVWQGNIQTDAGPQETCQQLLLGPDGQALIGPCGEAETPVELLPIHSQEWARILDRFAPFEYETPEEQVIFRGRGEVAGPAWERAVAAWARFTYQELQAGRVGASYKVVMSWWLGEIPEQPGYCAHLVVLAFGYAYANVDPCPGEAGGPSLSSTTGWLETEEWAQFDAWLYNNGQVYQGDNYFSGLGSQEMTEPEIAQLDEWARAVYARLAGAAESALSGCPEPTEETELLRNEDHGYCLLYPEGYSVEQPTENETVILVGSLMDVEHPKLFIEVSPAEGRTAEEVADALAAEVEAAMPDYEVERTAGLTIGGEPAVQLDQMPGQDLNRQVLVVQDDRLYKLTFVPADEQLGDIFRQMEELYNTVIDSFRFLN